MSESTEQLSQRLSQRPTLDEIADEFSAAIRRGETPSIASYLERYPSDAEELAKLLSSVAMIEGLKKQTLDSDSRPSPLPAIDIEGFEIVREVGRGGMGIVLEAIQQALQRRVAIKVLGGNLTDGNQHLARFHTEARAAARLRHPHIVPVFGVGSTNDCHYYVMDFIEGHSLREILETRSSEPTPKRVAEVGSTVCDALSYAHDQGVLHRDIKPANLMVDQKDCVWIADFGLAKLSEPSELTRTGEVIGTPQYMPPESFDGIYDERSEVYSVGLTLYEMLSGRPAVQARTAVETIRKATVGVTVPPSKFNQGVPADLDTVVMKALSVDPMTRYASAAAMRDDLNCFLTNRPIQAKRSGLAQRTVRWFRREPRIAALTLCTIVLLAALASLSGVGYLQAKRAYQNEQRLSLDAVAARSEAEAALESKTAALRLADEQKSLAEQNLQTALSAFDQIMGNVTRRSLQADNDLWGEVTDTTAANVGPDDAKLLGTLLVFFDELAENNSEELLAEAAAAAKSAGDIYLSLGELRQADEAYGKANQRFERLWELQPDKSEHLADYAYVLNSLAFVSGLRGQLQRSQSLFYRVRDLMQTHESNASPEAQFEFAKAHRLVATIRSRIGLSAPPERFRQRRRLQAGRSKVTTRHELDLADLETAIELLQKLIDSHPGNERYLSELARAFRSKAELQSHGGEIQSAEEALTSSIEILKQLLMTKEGSDAIRYELALSFVANTGQPNLQPERANAAADLCQQLLTTAPDLPRYQLLRARTLEVSGDLKAADDDFRNAETDYWQAVRIYVSLTKQTPELRQYHVRRAQALETIADLKIAQGEIEGAREIYRRTIQRLQVSQRLGNNSPIIGLLVERLRRKSEPASLPAK